MGHGLSYLQFLLHAFAIKNFTKQQPERPYFMTDDDVTIELFLY